MKKILIFSIVTLLALVAIAQHPDRRKIDSLKNILSSTHGVERINCLNALSEEYWWPPRVLPDSISCWAGEACQQALTIKYTYGFATAVMHLGVADIYRKNFITSEKFLRQALSVFEDIHSEIGLGWCNLWLGQNLYSQNNYEGARACIIRSLAYLDKLNFWEGQGKAWAWMGFIYAASGNYDSSFYYCSKSLLIRKKMSDDVCVAAALTNMGHLYRVAGDVEDALDFYRQGMNYANTHAINFHALNWNYFDEPIGIIYRIMNQPDSSLYYLKTALQIDPANQMTRISLGETFLLKQQYDSALKIFMAPIEHFRKENDRWDLMRVLQDAAKANEGKGNSALAKQYLQESLFIAQQSGVKQYEVEDYLMLSKIYRHLMKNDSAYIFIQRYTSAKDSLLTRQFMFRLSNYKERDDYKKQVERVALLDQENKAKEERLRQASMLRWGLILAILVALLSATVVYRNLLLKRKNEKLQYQQTQSQFKLKASDLEMQALRAQMNPHFIFNCLSSINRYILKNETEAASDYLTKFSRLIRIVLTNSKKTFISLEDELVMLRLYLDMEKLRFKNMFDYTIGFINTVDETNIFIPPMLLQPFAENAIWHGLMHKDGQGKLEIMLSAEHKILTCTITDNGVGRQQAALLKSKSAESGKSMGINITSERLALLNKGMTEQNWLEVRDLIDDNGCICGTRVILRIPYHNLTEAFA